MNLKPPRNAEATAGGEATLDAFHPYGRVRRLAGKPAPLFVDDDAYLRLHLAEKDGLLKSTVALPADVLERRLLEPLRELYRSSNVSDVAQQWNDLREVRAPPACDSLHSYPPLCRSLSPGQHRQPPTLGPLDTTCA